MDASHVTLDIFLRVLIVSGQASLLALLIVALQRLLRGCLSPAWRHALWSLLLVRLLLLWSMPASWSLFTLLDNVWRSTRNVIFAPAAHAFTSGESVLPALATGGPAFSAIQWVVGLWICGVAITLALAVMQACRLGRQAKSRARVNDPGVLALLDACRGQMGIRKRVPILCGPDTSAPALLGFLWPRLLMPARLLVPEARDQLRCVFLHELAHIRRQDVLTGWLAYVLLSLHWFNPVLWWAKRRCTDDRELACDARVLFLLTPKERRAYGHALLDQFRMTSTPFSSPGLVGVLEGSPSIERRIEMIASFDQTIRRSGMPAVLAALLLAVTTLTGAEESTMTQQPTEVSAPVSAASERVMLLAREMPLTRSLPLPAETTVEIAPLAEASPPVEEAAAPVAATVTEPKPAVSPAPAAVAPVKTDKNRAKAAAAKNAKEPAAAPVTSPADPAVYTTGITVAPDTTFVPGPAASVEKTALPRSAEKSVGKNPATLHTAISKAAKDYAQSLEVKSTRPGEDPPFTLTVGGSIQVRGEYWSGMPKHGGRSRGDHAATSMRTRVSLCADFGQVQCVTEASKTEGGSGFYRPVGVD